MVNSGLRQVGTIGLVALKLTGYHGMIHEAWRSLLDPGSQRVTLSSQHLLFELI